MKGFLVSFTPVSKETGKPFLYTGTNATVEIKMGNQKYILYGEISGNNIVLNLMADQNKYIPSGAVENNIDTQELLRMIYNSKDDVEFALNGTCRFVLYKGNFNDVFDGADWNNPEPINGKSANGNNDTKEADEKNNKTPEDPTPEPKVKVEPEKKKGKNPFYGIWCSAFKNKNEAKKDAQKFKEQGFDAYVCVTTDWSNLNSVKWYVVTIGKYETEDEASLNLGSVQAVYPDAYIKYTGKWKG